MGKGKEITFIYHPTKEKQQDLERAREIQMIITTYLVKKTLEKKATYN